MGIRVTPAGVIGSLALFVAMSGTAVAANGKPVLLGRGNSETKPTAITNPNGVALKLASKKGTPPFTVGGNSTRVPGLNASLLGGFQAGALQSQSKVFRVAGNYTVTVPTGFHHLVVTVIGGGGGGGGSTTGYPGSGSGGGSGGSETVWIPVKPGQKYEVGVGAGGAGGALNADGAPGTRSVVYLEGQTGSSFVAFAGPGSRGLHPISCGTGRAGGAPGSPEPVSPWARSRGAVVIEHRAGTAGGSSVYILGDCDSPLAGSGADNGFAGGGGKGGVSGGPASSGEAGEVGLAILQFLR